MKLHSPSRFGALFALAAAIASGPASAQTDLTNLVEPLKTYRFGDSTAALDTIAARVSASRAAPEQRRAMANALAEILSSNAGFDAKQFACRQLVFVADDEQVQGLASLLSDDALAHYALLVLARLRSPAAADAAVKALPGSHGRTEIEILDTLADLGDARVVGAAESRLVAQDSALRDAAAAALAKIADGHALDLLLACYSRAGSADQARLGHVLLGVANRVQHLGNPTAAIQIYDTLNRNSANPVLSAAAMRGIAVIQGDRALPMLLEALAQEGTHRQAVAAVALRELPGPAVIERLAGAVTKLHGRSQLLALQILSERPGTSAAPAIVALRRSTIAAVRTAALRAAGSLGDPSAVPILISAAAAGGSEERAAARDSLVRLRGAAVDRALMAVLDTGAPPAQVEAIVALGRRGSMGITPRLLKAARNSNANVRVAALRVIRDQGTPTSLPALTDLLMGTLANDRDPVIDAVAQIVRRFPEARVGLPALLDRLGLATSPADRLALVMVIGQVGGQRAFTALRRATGDPASGVRLAALSALAEWPTDEPMPDLLRIARAAQDASQRALALRGYLRMAGSSELRTPDEAFGLIDQVRSIAVRPEEKRLILAGLSRFPSLKAIEYAESLVHDPDVGSEAELAVVEIGRVTCGAWPQKTCSSLESIAKSGKLDAARKRAESVLAATRGFGDFVVAWEVSPAYQRDGADYARLFDVPFAPEDGNGAGVPWRLMPPGAGTDLPWLLDLLALLGGEQRVAYLRSSVWTESPRDLVLEAGSDDGLKVWWNGSITISHNTARAVAPRQEKATVHANAGWNQILMKVTQSIQGWGACARLTAADGSPAIGLRFAIPSSVN